MYIWVQYEGKRTREAEHKDMRKAWLREWGHADDRGYRAVFLSSSNSVMDFLVCVMLNALNLT